MISEKQIIAFFLSQAPKITSSTPITEEGSARAGYLGPSPAGF